MAGKWGYGVTRPAGVDVLMPTWNRKWLCAQAVDELLKKFNDPRVHIVIWDNKCGDGTTEYLKKRLKGVKFKGKITHHVAKKNHYSNSWYEAYSLGTGGRFVIPSGDDLIWWPEDIVPKVMAAYPKCAHFGFVGFFSLKDSKSVGGYFSRFKYRSEVFDGVKVLVDGPIGTPGITSRGIIGQTGGLLSLKIPKWGGFDSRLTQGCLKKGYRIGLFSHLRVYHANSPFWNRFNKATYDHKHRTAKGQRVCADEFRRWEKLEPGLHLFEPGSRVTDVVHQEIYDRAEEYRREFGIKELEWL